jgi:Circularly permutated YpsA SLOG family
MRLAKIISGGQTGIDRGTLDAAIACGFPCGGWCPSGRLAEDGQIPECYPVIEIKKGRYRQRTLRNVLESDGTAILYFSRIEGGTEETLLFCIKKHKPYKLVDAEEVSAERAAFLLASFVRHYDIGVLNVAGPRQSKAPHAYAYAYAVTNLLFQDYPGEGTKER